jgi:hypothetical protein
VDIIIQSLTAHSKKLNSLENLLEYNNYLILENLNLRDKKDLAISTNDLVSSLAFISSFAVSNPNLSTAIALTNNIAGSWLGWKVKDFEKVKKTKEGKDLFKSNRRLYKSYEKRIEELNKIYDTVVDELGYKNELKFEKFIAYTFNDKTRIFKAKKYKEVKNMVLRIDKRLVNKIKDDIKNLYQFKDEVANLYDHLEITNKI